MAFMIVAAVASAAISGYTQYLGNKAAQKTAEKAAQDAKDWRAQVTAAAKPYGDQAQSALDLAGQALGTGGQEGVQNFLAKSLNPLLAGAQDNSATALNQKLAAMGYGPGTGTQMNEMNKLMQGSYLDQYNKQVAGLQQQGATAGGIFSNLYNTAGATGNPMQATLQSGQYAGQAIAGAGAAAAKGVSSVSDIMAGYGQYGQTGQSYLQTKA